MLDVTCDFDVFKQGVLEFSTSFHELLMMYAVIVLSPFHHVVTVSDEKLHFMAVECNFTEQSIDVTLTSVNAIGYDDGLLFVLMLRSVEVVRVLLDGWLDLLLLVDLARIIQIVVNVVSKPEGLLLLCAGALSPQLVKLLIQHLVLLVELNGDAIKLTDVCDAVAQTRIVLGLLLDQLLS